MTEFPVLSSIAAVAAFQRLFSILLMPGFYVGFTVSGNIHVTSPLVVTGTNFVFYFALAYLAVTLWPKLKAKSAARWRVARPLYGQATVLKNGEEECRKQNP